MALTLAPIEVSAAEWDRLIAPFPTRTIFHESCWFEHVRSIHPSAKVVRLSIARDGEVIGYFTGVRIRRAFVRVLGSPLPGTGTNFGGFLLRPEALTPEVVVALHGWCRRNGIHHLELSQPWLDREDPAKLALEAYPSVTHIVPLEGGEKAVWDAMKGPCRNRIRKAEKNGLVVEVTDDPAVVDHFYDQYVEVYAKQGLVLPFGVERPRSLLASLRPSGRVLPMWVKQGEEIVAAGLFPFDDDTIYFWGAASWIRFHHLCPNELLHWAVIREAIARGIKQYNMCGGTSRFKDKFGGADVPYVRYSRSYLPGLPLARKVYERMHRFKLRAIGAIRGVDRNIARPAEDEG